VWSPRQRWIKCITGTSEFEYPAGAAFCVRSLILILIYCLRAAARSTVFLPTASATRVPRAPYARVSIPETYQRHLVEYHRKEAPGTIIIDSDSKYLYYVLAKGKAIRYGVTVGEEAQAWSGVARVGRMEEWPAWIPTEGEKVRLAYLHLPDRVTPGPHNPMGARGLYLYEGNKDTLYRIHGTNQPEYIGRAISSGCIRMTNEDVIDLYNRVRLGAPVVVLPRGRFTFSRATKTRSAGFTATVAGLTSTKVSGS
jgi:lipoprotein-anchoring transpeptidase ErfK/SrfK